MNNIHNIEPFKVMLKFNFKEFNKGDILTVKKLHHLGNKIFYETFEFKPHKINNIKILNCIEEDFFVPLTSNEYNEINSVLNYFDN